MIVRRVKCDERFPLCRNCESTGRTCDGYEFLRSLGSMSLVRCPPSFPQLTFSNAKEGRAFSYFHQRVSIQLAGFHDDEFWLRLVIPIAATDSSVRNALIALAALHEDFVEDGSSCGRIENTFALSQYNKAIKRHIDDIREHVQSTCIELYLVPCLIFICIEVSFTSECEFL